MPEEVFSQRPVEALYDALVPVDVNPTASNLARVLRQQLTDGAQELMAAINLKELRHWKGLRLEIQARPSATSSVVLLVRGSASL